MAQSLKVIAINEEGEVIAIVKDSNLAKEAEKFVDKLNEEVGKKKFDNLGLSIEIHYFDWARSEAVENIPTIKELIAQADEEAKNTVSTKTTREVIADGGNLLDLMLA